MAFLLSQIEKRHFDCGQEALQRFGNDLALLLFWQGSQALLMLLGLDREQWDSIPLPCGSKSTPGEQRNLSLAHHYD